MKIYEYRNESWGKVFDKISTAFHKHAPSDVEWVDTVEESDIQMIHIIGPGEVEVIEKSPNRILIQQCYFTAGYKDVDYPSYWKDSLLTMSFHNLPDYTDVDFEFYRTAWGADPSLYRFLNRGPREIKAFTTGHVAKTESIDEVHSAIREVGKTLYHTGENFSWKNGYRHLDYMSESRLVYLLNSVQYVPCLRKIEGFELMGIEGLMCGARPIVFDLPTYDFYKGHAEIISTKNIEDQLVEIFSREPRPVTDKEYQEILEKFSWKNIISKIFTRIYERI
jgi:hypothetical protein